MVQERVNSSGNRGDRPGMELSTTWNRSLCTGEERSAKGPGPGSPMWIKSELNCIINGLFKHLMICMQIAHTTLKMLGNQENYYFAVTPGT